MIKITAEASQPANDREDVTLHFSGLPAGRAQLAAKLAADLSQALADGKLDVLEAVQIGMDIKAIIRPV